MHAQPRLTVILTYLLTYLGTWSLGVLPCRTVPCRAERIEGRPTRYRYSLGTGRQAGKKTDRKRARQRQTGRQTDRMSFDQPLPPFNASDPTATFLSSSCLDFLLIELVPMAYRVTNELEEGAVAGAAATAATKANNNSGSGDDGIGGGGGGGGGGRTSSTTTRGGANARNSNGNGNSRLLDEDEERDAVFFRLEALGYRVGLGLVERFSRDRPRFNDALDAIKFVCKDLWMLVFRKQVDNLKTNHRGVYVLTDNSFRPLARMSADAGGQAVARAQPVCVFCVLCSVFCVCLLLLSSLCYAPGICSSVYNLDWRPVEGGAFISPLYICVCVWMC